MKLDNKKMMIIGGLLLAVGIGVYFWRKRKGESEESETIDVDAVEVDANGNEITKSTSGSVDTDSVDDPRYSSPINPNLNWIKNKKLASYIGTVLSKGDENRLRGWVSLIEKEQKADPTKWKPSDGVTGQDHRIMASLYQMKIQTEALSKKSGSPKTHTPPNVIWSNTVKFGIQDAQ